MKDICLSYPAVLPTSNPATLAEPPTLAYRPLLPAYRPCLPTLPVKERRGEKESSLADPTLPTDPAVKEKEKEGG